MESSAQAAVDKVVEMGVVDRERIGVTGHSHGGERDGRGQEKHHQAQPVGTEDEINAKLRNDREARDELKTGLCSIESRRQNQKQDEIQGRCENRDGAGFSPEHHEDGRDQRDWLRAPDMTARVTRDQLRDAARLYLRRESYVRFTLLPESAAPPRPTPDP